MIANLKLICHKLFSHQKKGFFVCLVSGIKFYLPFFLFFFYFSSQQKISNLIYLSTFQLAHNTLFCVTSNRHNLNPIRVGINFIEIGAETTR